MSIPAGRIEFWFFQPQPSNQSAPRNTEKPRPGIPLIRSYSSSGLRLRCAAASQYFRERRHHAGLVVKHHVLSVLPGEPVP